MAKILVTGGLGFIGHNVVANLEAQGHTVIITDTQTTYGIIPKDELEYLMAERRRRLHTTRIYGVDITDQDGVRWLLREHRPDTVIHLASFPRQKVVNSNPAQGSRVMIEGLINLLEARCKSCRRVNRFKCVHNFLLIFKDLNSLYQWVLLS